MSFGTFGITPIYPGQFRHRHSLGSLEVLHQLVDLLAACTGREGEIGKPVERTSHISEYVLEDTVIPVIVLTGLVKYHDAIIPFIPCTNVCYLNAFLLIPSNLLG